MKNIRRSMGLMVFNHSMSDQLLEYQIMVNVTCKYYSTCIDYIIYIINDYHDSIVYRE